MPTLQVQDSADNPAVLPEGFSEYTIQFNPPEVRLNDAAQRSRLFRVAAMALAYERQKVNWWEGIGRFHPLVQAFSDQGFKITVDKTRLEKGQEISLQEVLAEAKEEEQALKIAELILAHRRSGKPYAKHKTLREISRFLNGGKL